eukprot:CAMPEP_0114497378 /NCGR_PEP_ID=MMETSP0109-20121206/6295_1 /TAXON_ID=29199 /ORGANISM="Chlorarachnion reptans, Strain CCCM449" /LENGTH=270 /DNA_ID=CAMNT_0001674761 /DNA_START=266 /DNA_END=1079 /DNA_ORIENTATION=-
MSSWPSVEVFLHFHSNPQRGAESQLGGCNQPTPHGWEQQEGQLRFFDDELVLVKNGVIEGRPRVATHLGRGTGVAFAERPFEWWRRSSRAVRLDSSSTGLPLCDHLEVPFAVSTPAENDPVVDLSGKDVLCWGGPKNPKALALLAGVCARFGSSSAERTGKLPGFQKEQIRPHAHHELEAEARARVPLPLGLFEFSREPESLPDLVPAHEEPVDVREVHVPIARPASPSVRTGNRQRRINAHPEVCDVELVPHPPLDVLGSNLPTTKEEG